MIKNCAIQTMPKAITRLLTAAVLCAAFAAFPCWASPKRIVSVSPVGTEILYALGQEKNIAGVTNFCDYPPAAKKKPKIGGFSDINFEQLIAAKADLVVLQDMHRHYLPDLKKLHIPVFVARQENIAQVCDSIERLGAVCGAKKTADKITAEMMREIEAISKKTAALGKPRVLVCVSRELTEPAINTFYAAGRRSFYSEIIEKAGGVNAVTDTKAQYPKISQEGLAAIDPDIIIDLVGEREFYHSIDNVDTEKVFNKKYLTDQWLAGPRVKAVRAGRITILGGTIYLRPGPRLPRIMEAFAKAIHPEAFN